MYNAAFLAALVFAVAHSASAVDCKESLKALGPTAMQMSFDEFDQSEKGWRSLSNVGCFTEAATLIERYANSNPSRARVLRWHMAQMLAMAGDHASAAAAAELTLSPQQEQVHPEFDWNSYANATIAFLKGDQAGFEKHRTVLRSITAKFPMNEPNAEALERLARCFGKPYAEAYSCNASSFNGAPGGALWFER